jgi:hypothetical protein
MRWISSQYEAHQLVTSITPPSRQSFFSFCPLFLSLHIEPRHDKMHRLARIKKALHISKSSHIVKIPDSPPLSQPVLQNLWNFNFNSNGVAGGYTCPTPTTCGLCHHFLSPSFVYQLFTKKFFDLGQTTDLFAWSRASECPLCHFLCVSFVDATGGQIPLDARVVVRWNTRDTAVKGGRRDEVRSWDFQLMSMNMSVETGAFKTWPAAMDCWTEEGMWTF